MMILFTKKYCNILYVCTILCFKTYLNFEKINSFEANIMHTYVFQILVDDISKREKSSELNF